MNIQELIRKQAIAKGVNPDAAVAIAKIESGFDPLSNKNSASQHKGLYQLGTNEWANYGNGDIYDPAANTNAFLDYYKNNSNALAKTLGREPTAAESYLAHQQGAAGAGALLMNPDKNAVDAIAPYYSTKKKAMDVITGNGGDPNAKASDFVNLWNSKYGSAIGNGPATSYKEAGTADTATPAPNGLLAEMDKRDPSLEMGFGLLANSNRPAPQIQMLQPVMRRPQPFTGFNFLG
jgi:hypothetical protein